MTGFGAAEGDGVKVEVSSLNHRYIDISLKMPSMMLEHEIPVRTLVKEKFSRGKFTITVSMTDREYKIAVNKELAKEMYEAFSDLQKELSIPGSVSIDFLSGYRDLLITERSEYSAEVLFGALRDALLQTEAMRVREGEKLSEELGKRLRNLQEAVMRIEVIKGDVVDAHKDMLSRRIAELLPAVSIDEARIAQEIALMAQKSDITEELARLRSHLGRFEEVLSEGGVVGKRLDFLLQECHREVNTIASKVNDIRIINYTIDLKSEIEKLREQVQNIQ